MKRWLILFLFFFAYNSYAQSFFLDTLLELSSYWDSFIGAKEKRDKSTESDLDAASYAARYTESFIALLESFLDHKLDVENDAQKKRAEKIDDSLAELKMQNEDRGYAEALLYMELLFYTSYARDFFIEADQKLNQLIAEVFERKFTPTYIAENEYLFLSRSLFYSLHARIEKHVSSHWLPDLEDTEVFFKASLHRLDSGLSAKEIRAKQYSALSSVESLYSNYLAFQKSQDSKKRFLFSEEMFYSFLNKPSFLYYLFHMESYFPLRDAFLSSAEIFLEIDQGIIEEIKKAEFDFLYDSSFSFFYRYFYKDLYAKIPDDKGKESIALVYKTNDLFYQSFIFAAKYGFSIDAVLTEDNQLLYSLFLSDPFLLSLYDAETMGAFCDNLIFIQMLSDIYINRINRLPSIQRLKG